MKTEELVLEISKVIEHQTGILVGLQMAYDIIQLVESRNIDAEFINLDFEVDSDPNTRPVEERGRIIVEEGELWCRIKDDKRISVFKNNGERIKYQVIDELEYGEKSYGECSIKHFLKTFKKCENSNF